MDRKEFFLIIMVVAVATGLTACGKGSRDTSSDKSGISAVQENDKDEKNGDESTGKKIINPEGSTLETRFATPEGYERIAADSGSFQEFLRNYELKADGEPVLLYNGREKGNQRAHAAVFKLPIENYNLQQCADSVIRVYSEYFRATGQEDRISFHFTNGFVCDYNSWKNGKRVAVSGNDVVWTGGGKSGDTDENFISYLKTVFNYAGTMSMDAESEAVDIEDIQAGDIFIRGGSPGHVVMVMDVCQKDGEKAFLLGQGYMPAQEFHVLVNPMHGDDPWYYAGEVTYPFHTPEYTFDEGSLKRPAY